MSQHKSVSRQQQQNPESLENSKYRQQARQLEELFPNWSNEDLQLLLVEVQGDVELAATRISEGRVQPWGSVSRKKDKKVPASAHASKKDLSASRGDSRGARSGRGGRAGSARGGATQRGRPPKGAVNGRSPGASNPDLSQADELQMVSVDRKDLSEPIDLSTSDVPESANKSIVTPTAWTDPSSSSHIPTPYSSTSWVTVNPTSTWSSDGDPHGSYAAALPTNTKSPAKPANSKLSWAQVASSQEKQATTVSPPASSYPLAGPPPLAAIQSPDSELQPEPQSLSWEEPTTAQPPTWDEESQGESGTPDVGSWIAPGLEQSTEEQFQPHSFTRQRDSNTDTSTKPALGETEKQSQSTAPTSEAPPVPPAAASTLSQTTSATASPRLSGRSSASAHRHSARYKNIDQPVVMPSSFGTGIEKMGMQFGSLGLGGESVIDPNPSELEAPPAAADIASPHTPKPQTLASQEPPPQAAQSVAPSSLTTSIFSHQQAQPQASQSPSVQPPPTLHTLPSSTQTQQGLAHTSSTSPLQPFVQHQAQQTQQQAQHHQAPSQVQQHALTSPHQQQSQQQSQQSLHAQPHNQYTQHGLPTHIDPIQQTQSQQQQQNNNHTGYFGRGEATAAPYFHTPTPPAGQGQDNPYGSFGQLNAQAPHQQASHLGNFGTQDYGYSDGQRGFYDNYQPGSFGSRSGLGHEDVKGLQATQQPTASSGIPPSNAQAAQPHGSLQGGGQPQPANAQAPQQGYHMPYGYYTYPQGQQFYGYNSYPALPQPFKYPAMYQPPPGPGSAPSPVGKQPNTSVQPQGNPYGQGLYPQGGYDDYNQHPLHSQHSQQHSHGLGLSQNSVGASDYGKQLYGGTGQGSIQAFMGIGAQGASGGAPSSNANGPRGGGSPETPYKPYTPKDVSSVTGRVGGQQQSQVQGQAQAQSSGTPGSQGQGFYGGARFGGGAGGTPQQGAHHPQAGPQGHLGYPQGGNDGSFYQYRGQQQGYWQ